MTESTPQKTPKSKREHAIALQYTELDALPKIIASGAGEIARQILALAEEHGIPIQHDSTLTDMLSSLSVGSSISPDSYRIVAELISFLYHSDQRFRDRHQELKPKMIEEPFDELNDLTMSAD